VADDRRKRRNLERALRTTSGRCWSCGARLSINGLTSGTVAAVAELITPPSAGGTYQALNIRPSCAPCNQARATRVEAGTATVHMPTSNSNRILAWILERDGPACCHCGVPLSIEGTAPGTAAATFEHVRPASRKGARVLPNGRAACQPCNSARGSTIGILDGDHRHVYTSHEDGAECVFCGRPMSSRSQYRHRQEGCRCEDRARMLVEDPEALLALAFPPDRYPLPR